MNQHHDDYRSQDRDFERFLLDDTRYYGPISLAEECQEPKPDAKETVCISEESGVVS